MFVSMTLCQGETYIECELEDGSVKWVEIIGWALNKNGAAALMVFIEGRLQCIMGLDGFSKLLKSNVVSATIVTFDEDGNKIECSSADKVSQ